jgi:hypothetical protein
MDAEWNKRVDARLAEVRKKQQRQRAKQRQWAKAKRGFPDMLGEAIARGLVGGLTSKSKRKRLPPP